jgi:Fe-S-cluster containining protein
MSTPLDTLLALHAEVDVVTDRLNAVHAKRLRCQLGCAMCCVDDLTVFEVEAERIRANHATLLAMATPRAPGACAFLDDDGACRVYADRPYVCRTQGLPLRWWAEDDDGEIVEQRDICPLNETSEPLESIAEDDCLLLGPFEQRLADLQASIDGGELRRIALRDLFASKS